MSFSFGKSFKITIFGESHGACVGVAIEGCPPGQEIDTSLIQKALDNRKPGQSIITTQRREKDKVETFSGILNGKTTGAPLVLLIRNKDVDSSFYEEIKNTPRPGHADLAAWFRYNGFHDYRGGGIFSGRMTAAFVMAGAVAKQILAEKGIKVLAHAIQIGNVRICREISNEEIEKNVYTSNVRCADLEVSGKMKEEILKVKKEGDSVGGMVECRVLGIPPGIGNPIFDSIESVLSHMIFSIPGVKGIGFGSGFDCVSMKGSEHNDPFFLKDGKIVTATNNAGGILGGISDGMPIAFRVAVKPTSSIMKLQKTVDLKRMEECKIRVRGRHDPCIVVRAVPVIEAATCIVLVDLCSMEC